MRTGKYPRRKPGAQALVSFCARLPEETESSAITRPIVYYLLRQPYRRGTTLLAECPGISRRPARNGPVRQILRRVLLAAGPGVADAPDVEGAPRLNAQGHFSRWWRRTGCWAVCYRQDHYAPGPTCGFQLGLRPGRASPGCPEPLG